MTAEAAHCILKDMQARERTHSPGGTTIDISILYSPGITTIDTLKNCREHKTGDRGSSPPLY